MGIADVQANCTWHLWTVRRMRTNSKRILVVGHLTILMTAALWPGSPHECRAGLRHIRFVRSRCCVPRGYAYGNASPMAASVETSSGTAIPANFKLISGTESVIAREKRFVVNDVSAGPVRLTKVAALLEDNGRFRLTGIATHSGGDSGQLLGGKVVIYVRALATQSASSPVTWSAKYARWVKRGQPTAIEILSPNRAVSQRYFSHVTNIQVYLEYYPNR